MQGGPRAKHAWLWVIPSIIVVSLLALSNVLMRQQAPQRTPALATSPTAAVPGPPLTCARLEPASGICLSTAPLPCMCAAD